MAYTRKFQQGKAVGVVVANGELLALPTGSIGRWKNSFSQRVMIYAAQEAPANKRPRWSHYGTPLKRTMVRSQTDITDIPSPNGTRGFVLNSYVGSSAPYSLYVDQGTGVYNGGTPFEVKLLPPWAERGYEFAEVGNGITKGTTQMGQRGQRFFDRAIARAFMDKAILGRRRPLATAIPGLGSVAAKPFIMPASGATPNNAAFRAQRDAWRRGQGAPSDARRAEMQRARERARRERTAASDTDSVAYAKNFAADRAKIRQGKIDEARQARAAQQGARRPSEAQIRKFLAAKGILRVENVVIRSDGTFYAQYKNRRGVLATYRDWWDQSKKKNQ